MIMKSIYVEGAGIRSYPIVREIITKEVRLMLDSFIKYVNPNHKLFNLICTGTSGLYITTIMRLLEPDLFDIYYIRKAGDSAHSGPIVENLENINNPFMFVDDFISGGHTMGKCIHNAYGKHGRHITHVFLMGCCGDPDDAIKKIEREKEIHTLIIGKDW